MSHTTHDVASRAEPREADGVRAQLAERIARIEQAPTAPPDPAAVEREKQTVAQCRYLMGLLAIRRRSEHEMRERLVAREASADVVHEAMARIRRAGLVDDAAFAAEWIQQRRAARGLADDRLRRELLRRGVAAPLIDAALLDAADDEETRCRELVRDRLRRDRERLTDPTVREGDRTWRAIARRLDAFLARRGYDGALAVHVISTEMRAVSTS